MPRTVLCEPFRSHKACAAASTQRPPQPLPISEFVLTGPSVNHFAAIPAVEIAGASPTLLGSEIQPLAFMANKVDG
jgi:hypothetical protein